MRTTLQSLALLLLSTTASAQNVPQIELVPWASGLGTITDIAYAYADDSTKLFVAVKEGMVMIVSDSMTVSSQPFLDISAQVLSEGGEQGLLGLAFDPDYASNGAFYVNYITGTGPGISVISRFLVSNDPDSADATSEQIIWAYPQPFENHNGGDLAFGPDGYLYIPLGDGGGAGDPQGFAQDLGEPLGDILRLDVSDLDTTYTVPGSNPWIGGMGDTLPEIWASGLRNPFRVSFDRLSGDLWLGDVGQSSWEEVNYLQAGTGAGSNFGWRCFEGPAVFNAIDCEADSAYTLPVTAHINDGNFGEWCSVIGGYVYRGTRWPNLYGRYIYTDYCKSQFWSLRPEGDNAFVDELLGDAETMMAWTTFGEDAEGELYVGNEQGDIYWITDRCPMDAPVLSFNGVTLSSTFSDSTYVWYLNGLAIPGANASTYVPVENGDYYVQAIYKNGCVLNSDTLSIVITNVPELARPRLSLYPNPVEERLILEWNGPAVVDSYRVIDLQGREVGREQGLSTSRIVMSVAALADGNYFVLLLSPEGAMLTAEQFTVSH